MPRPKKNDPRFSLRSVKAPQKSWVANRWAQKQKISSFMRGPKGPKRRREAFFRKRGGAGSAAQQIQAQPDNAAEGHYQNGVGFFDAQHKKRGEEQPGADPIHLGQGDAAIGKHH